MHVPWRAIMTSAAMWAIIFAQFCDNFGNYALMTKLPAFMREVLKFDITSVSNDSSMLTKVKSFATYLGLLRLLPV